MRDLNYQLKMFCKNTAMKAALKPGWGGSAS